MTLLLATLALAQQQEPIVPELRPGIDGRGRDPWVFRCVFEDRTRMVVITPKPGVWIVFNPETCALYKVWHGDVDFRGKVWDFSQDNSRSKGKLLYAAPNEIYRATSASVTLDRAEALSEGWKLPARKGSVTTRSIDLSGWRRVFVAFDETSRKGRMKVDVLKADRIDQWFESTLSVDSETNWQWNFKRIERPSATVRLRFSAPTADKSLRNIRLYGDRPAWVDSAGRPLEVEWRGYSLQGQTKGVKLQFNVLTRSGKRVAVEYEPVMDKLNWQDRFDVTGLPNGESIYLRREGVGATPEMRFDRNGHYPLYMRGA